jgi:hypothetical protein
MTWLTYMERQRLKREAPWVVVTILVIVADGLWGWRPVLLVMLPIFLVILLAKLAFLATGRPWPPWPVPGGDYVGGEDKRRKRGPA